MPHLSTPHLHLMAFHFVQSLQTRGSKTSGLESKLIPCRFGFLLVFILLFGYVFQRLLLFQLHRQVICVSIFSAFIAAQLASGSDGWDFVPTSGGTLTDYRRQNTIAFASCPRFRTGWNIINQTT